MKLGNVARQCGSFAAVVWSPAGASAGRSDGAMQGRDLLDGGTQDRSL